MLHKMISQLCIYSINVHKLSTKYLLKTLYSLQLTDTITYLYTWWYCSSCWFSLFVYLVSVYHIRDNLGRNIFTVFKNHHWLLRNMVKWLKSGFLTKSFIMKATLWVEHLLITFWCVHNSKPTKKWCLVQLKKVHS